ncbi:MAG: TatD family hydrolase [Rikenellaceae bacterium]
MKYIDTHSHLSDNKYIGDINEVILRSREGGVELILMPDCGSEGREELAALCSRNEGYLRPMVGVHPTTINEVGDWRIEVDEVERLLANSAPGGYCAVGEIGLDYYWSKDHVEAQRAAFVAQCELAIKFDLPVNIHTRDAWSDMCEILEGFKGRGLRGVMHAFCDTEESYLRISDCGDFYFSIGGVVTFKKSQVAKVVPRIPLDRLLLETDAPYLTPSPHRGERNEPAYLEHICAKIAELKGLTAKEVADATYNNAKRLFRLR